VRKTREQVDLLLVSAHWGPNWGYSPPREHIPFAHALIEAGADIIFGHSGHIVRGIEIYKGKPILYCTGDFVDDYAVDPGERNDLGFIFVVEIDGRNILRLLLYPTFIKYCQVVRAKDAERKQIVAKMQNLCAELQTVTSWNEQEECLEVRMNRHVIGQNG
jgi:poly-gamma-glutamate synthesis protein (capsule biosynthesis protein)